MTDDRAIKDDPRTVFGWCMYDWANSAYVTTVAVGLLPRYFADVVVPPGGIVALFLAGLLLLSFVDVDKARRAPESRAF